MYFNKNVLSKCDQCPLINQTLVEGDTNSRTLRNIDICIFAEAPALEEVKNNKVLVGRAGKVFRKAFEESKLSTMQYYIGNVVQCANLTEDNKTVNPPVEAQELCKPNWQRIVDILKPKLILIMGKIPMTVFGIGDLQISKVRGNIFKYKNYDVIATYHPSYILRSGGNLEEGNGLDFLNDMVKSYHYVNGNKDYQSPVQEVKVINLPVPTVEVKKEVKMYKDDIHCIKLPDWCYSSEYALYDIQHIYDNHKLYYIFKDLNNNRKILDVDDSLYYFYAKKNEKNLQDCPTYISHKQLELVKNQNKVPFGCVPYEKDVSVVQRHSIDYRYMREKLGVPEPEIPLKLQFMDIEVYNEGSKEFPKPENAAKPINSISFVNGDGPINVYLLLMKGITDMSSIKPLSNGTIVRTFGSEKELLEAYFKATTDYEPDTIAAWNGIKFDYPYIYNRCKKIGVNINKWSSLGCFMYDEKGYFVKHTNYGTFLVDSQVIYQRFNEPLEGKKESYKLDYISRCELGEGKVAYEGTLDLIYTQDINKFIEYSSVDTELIRDIETKRKYIALLAEMIKLCSSSWTRSNSTMGLVDPLVLGYAKRHGLVCRNGNKEGIDDINDDDSFGGAFVNYPKIGVHNWVVDLDFSALYPSIIRTFNIDTMTYKAKVPIDVAYAYIYDRSKLPENIEITMNPWRSTKEKETISRFNFETNMEDGKFIITSAGTIFENHNTELSFIGQICAYVSESRDHYKDLKKKSVHNSDDYSRNDNRQLSFKILNNSLYGVLGNKYFRMYLIDLAETITMVGQEALKFSQYHVNKYMENGNKEIDVDFINHDVNSNQYIIYGDTDSLFINVGKYLKDKKII